MNDTVKSLFVRFHSVNFQKAISKLTGENFSQVGERNAWYFNAEILFATFLTIAATFNNAYAIRMGASNALIGLLASLPALIGILVSIPAGQILKKQKNLKPFVFTNLLINRLGYVLIVLLPWIFGISPHMGTIIIVILIAISLPGQLFSVGFTPIMAISIPEKKRAAVISSRHLIWNIALCAGTYMAGIWLDHIKFPVNYYFLYLFGFSVSLLSQFLLNKIQIPDNPPQEPTSQTKNSLLQNFKHLIQNLKAYQQFSRFSINTVFHIFGLWLINPLFSLLFVKQLNATDGWLGLHSAINYGATIIGIFFWRKIINGIGKQRTLKITTMLAGIYPLLVGLLPDLSFILIAVGVNGFIAPGIALSHSNSLFSVLPEDKRPEFTAIYLTLVNLAVFAGPILGTALANIFGYQMIIILGGILCIIGSATFTIFPVNNKF